MAKEDYTALKAQTEKELVDSIIQSIKEGVPLWQRPWEGDAETMFQYNPDTGTVYRGVNFLRLYSVAQKNGYKDNRWYTYNSISRRPGCYIEKGTKGVPVYKYIQFDKLTKKDADWDAIKKLPREEQQQYIRENILAYLKYSGAVFNAERIHNIEAMPQVTEKEREKQTLEVNQKLEAIIEHSQAPITHGGNEAYYVPATDKIHLPEREKFYSSEGYYSTALHEIAHSTGHESRLNRDLTGGRGMIEYAKEELVAELSSLYLSLELGAGSGSVGKPEFENHTAYLKHWVSILENDYTEFYKASGAASKAASFIKQHCLIESAAAASVVEQGKPLIVNLYGGPGAGKTTAAMEITVALKKAGYNVEYVSEYAKELVLKNELDKLGNQQHVTDEQFNRLDRLRGSVDIVVTDSPVLLGSVYGEGKIDDAYKAKIRGYYDSFSNLDMVVQRGDHYQIEGRLQTLDEARKLDGKITSMLQRNNIMAFDYRHDGISAAMSTITSAYKRILNPVAGAAAKPEQAAMSSSLAQMRSGYKHPMNQFNTENQDNEVLE